MTYKWLNEDERLLLGLLKAHSGDEYIDLNPDVVLGMLINLAAERERNAELVESLFHAAFDKNGGK